MILIEACIISIIFLIFVVVVLALKGRNLAEVLQAVNLLGTLVILFICLYGFLMGRPAFLDLAIIYALLNILGALALYKYLRNGDLGADDYLDSDKD